MSTDTMERPVEKVKSMFGEVDRKHLFDKETGEYKGKKTASSYPAYMQKKAKEQLEQSIEERQDALDNRHVSSSALEYTKRQLIKERQRLAEINEVPVFNATEKADMNVSFSALEQEVSSAQFTERDMETMKGIDPGEEARRMTEPCVRVDKLLAKRCNVELDAKTGMISRSQAEKILKITHWHLTGGDEPYLLENLRRKAGGSASKSNQITVGIDLKEMEIRNRIKTLEAREKEITQELEAEQAESKAEGYTCPDCNKTMKIGGKALHDSRWCEAKKQKGAE